MISVDLEFVPVSQGDVVKLVPDIYQQSGDESADAEQFTFIGLAGLERVDQILVGQIKVGFAGGLLDGVLVILPFTQISDGLVIMSVIVDLSLHGLLGLVLHFVVPLVDPGVVRSIPVFPEEFVPECREGLCSVFLLREEPLVSTAFERHFMVEEGHLVGPVEHRRLHVGLYPSDEVLVFD